MAKLLIYQGFTALFRLFFKVFFRACVAISEKQRVDKKDAIPDQRVDKKDATFSRCFLCLLRAKKCPLTLSHRRLESFYILTACLHADGIGIEEIDLLTCDLLIQQFKGCVMAT